LPPPPAQGFVGRSRELLALERLLAVERYAVLRGQGGEGKTALAVEFARWRVRARQVKRAAFVSVESHGHAQAVLDSVGRQLVGKTYSVAAYPTIESATEPVLRELREQPTLLVVDNLESVLSAPFEVSEGGSNADDPGRDAAVATDAGGAADAILALAAQLMAAGETRVVFTSREALPAPFDGHAQRIELHRLSQADAVQLVERTLGLDVAGQGREAEARREDIESLVDAVHGHARTLALLAPVLRERGVAATQADLVDLMREMERRFPGEREQSLLASVELSLRRLTPRLREQVKVLSVFHGAVDLDMLRHMTGWDQADVQALLNALVATGLATPDLSSHLSLNPALCPYLAAESDPVEREALTTRWTEAMREYVQFLERESNQKTEMAAALARMELPNLVALLERVERAGDASATIDLTTTLFALFRFLDRPRLLTRVAQARDAAARALGQTAWGHAQFSAECNRIEQLVDAGRIDEALAPAMRLHGRAQTAGGVRYAGADYDQAMACFLLGRTLRRAHRADEALSLLDEARRRFETEEARKPGCGAARMTSVAIAERASALMDLGRLDEAAEGYEQAIALAEQRADERDVAGNKHDLGVIRLRQGRLDQALVAFVAVRERFAALGEPRSLAAAWHQIGVVQQESGNGDAAEDAYRQALAIEVQHGDVAQQAATLGQLGNLYGYLLDRPEDAVTHYRQAADLYMKVADSASEGKTRHNLASTLRRLCRLPEARFEIERAIECISGLGHAAEPWKTWNILADIEADAQRPAEAGQAEARAIESFLAFRLEGGENHSPGGRFIAEIGSLLVAGHTNAANARLQQLASFPDTPAWTRPFIIALQAVAAGERNPSIAATPGLGYNAVELLLLLRTLTAADR
jgi:tetratricopeptide (TPR) repeat protein